MVCLVHIKTSNKLGATRVLFNRVLTMHNTSIGYFIVMHPIKDSFCFLGCRWVKFSWQFFFKFTFPSGWMILSHICLSIVSSGSSHVISSLERKFIIVMNTQEYHPSLLTYSGNSPRTRATYSLRIVPEVNSEVKVRARSAESAIIMSPDVSLSNRLTATEIAGIRYTVKGDVRIQAERTIDIWETKIIFKNFYKRVFEVTASRMHGLYDN